MLTYFNKDKTTFCIDAQLLMDVLMYLIALRFLGYIWGNLKIRIKNVHG